MEHEKSIFIIFRCTVSLLGDNMLTDIKACLNSEMEQPFD